MGKNRANPSYLLPYVSCDVALRPIDINIDTKLLFALHEVTGDSDIALEMAGSLKCHNKLIQEMQPERPTISVVATNGRKLWWQYLFKCAMKYNQHKKKDKIDLRHIVDIQIRKQRYMQLYKRKMVPYKYRNWLRPLNKTEIQELQDIEMKFPYSQILVFRCLAIAELRREMEKRDCYQSELRHHQDSNGKFNEIWRSLMDYVHGANESPDKYQLTETERRNIMREMKICQQIDDNTVNIKNPDNHIVAHLGLNVQELNVQLKDEELGEIAMAQIGFGAQFDFRSHSYSSRIMLNKIDFCLGSKRNLPTGSLLKALVTPFAMNIDIETEALDINKNHIRIHDLGEMELFLDLEVIQRHGKQIAELAQNVKSSFVESDEVEKAIKVNESGDVMAIEDLEESKENDDYVVQINDILLIESNTRDALYFVSLQAIESFNDHPDTELVGYWVILLTEWDSENEEEYVMIRDDDNTVGCEAGDDMVVIRLRNVVSNMGKERKIRGKYVRFSSQRQGGWVITDKDAFVEHLENVEEERLRKAVQESLHGSVEEKLSKPKVDVQVTWQS